MMNLVRKPEIRKAVLALAAVAGLCAAGAYGWHWRAVGRYMEATNDAFVKADTAVIAPKVTAYVDEVLVTDDQRVAAGALLIRLDGRDFRIARERALAAVAGAEARIASLDAGRLLQEAVLAQARADVALTEAEDARARSDADRYARLKAGQFASAQRFQQADAEHKKARAALARARAARDAAERQLGVLFSQRREAEAVLAGARADLAAAELDIAHCEIRSPVDGVVGNRSAYAGAYARAGVQLLAVVPAGGLWVEANFKENQISWMRTGQAVTIEADALPGVTLHGRVGGIAPATGAEFSILPAENATGNFTKIVQRVPVRVELDGEAARLGALRPGLSVTVRVNTKDRSSMLREAHAPSRPQRVTRAEP